MTRDLKFEAIYPYPPGRVWRAITDRRELSQWLMENDFEPRVGHSFTFRTDPAPGFDGIVHCRVIEVDEPHRLSFTWHGGWQGKPTVVTVTLEPVEGGTRLRLEHKGFSGLRGYALSLILGSGWRRLLHKNLRKLLAGTRDRVGTCT